MKKKIIILLSVVIILLMGIVVWFNIPLDLMDLDPNEVMEIVVFNGNSGNATHITDKEQIQHIVENLNGVEVKRSNGDFHSCRGETKKKSFSNKELVTMAKRIVNKAERNAERYDATSKFIQQKYGKSKQFRWIKGRMIIPVGYVAYEYPKYKRREVNKYVRKYSDIENCISYDVMKYMMGNAHLYPTLEMADNALSRYIAQKGKCAVTHNALSITDMVCIHIKPCKGERNDTYRNLIILSKDVSKLVDATENKVIKKLLQNLTLTVEMQEKINKLRKYRELEEIQFEDYIGTKM